MKIRKQNGHFIISTNFVKLPCNIGDQVFVIRDSLCKHRDNDTCSMYCEGYETDCEDYVGTPKIYTEQFHLSLLEGVGKTVFVDINAANIALGKILK